MIGSQLAFARELADMTGDRPMTPPSLVSSCLSSVLHAPKLPVKRAHRPGPPGTEADWPDPGSRGNVGFAAR